MTTLTSCRSGVLFVNKPSGPTSYDMIRWIKRSLKGEKIGHAGTLDPLASGLLIVLLGRATKAQDHFMHLEKTYLCQFRLGQVTDTADITGRVVEETSGAFAEEKSMAEILASFQGRQEQTPPMYSAIKQNGTPLYKLARKGITVEREAREITIHDITLTSIEPPSLVGIRVRCSSGTYVRTLVEDIGRKEGHGATLVSLRREAIGPYSVNDSIPGEDLKSMTTDDFWQKARPVQDL